jgi:CheY-like chemotaxis protein
MPNTHLIMPYIPGLRRFARALSGSQESGDTHIIGLLEALVATPSMLETEDTPKIALYRQFLKMWNALGTNAFPNLDASEAGTLRKLQSLTPKSRQAFLLLSLERFDPWEIASILDCSASEVVRLIAAADGEIASQLDPADILIIEDEALIALDLEEVVKSLGHTVVGLAGTCKQALAIAERHPPQLILSDIQLSDGSSGLEAVNEILSHFEVPVIFVTGHAEMLLSGTKPEPAFVITKPFDADAVKAVISQALFFEVRSRIAAAEFQVPEASGASPAAA